jgi:hypothetical protein
MGAPACIARTAYRVKTAMDRPNKTSINGHIKNLQWQRPNKDLNRKRYCLRTQNSHQKVNKFKTTVDNSQILTMNKLATLQYNMILWIMKSKKNFMF